MLHRSLLTGRYSDLSVRHEKQQWRAHKIVLAAQSPPGEPTTLRLDDYEALAVPHVMEYLYSGNYLCASAAATTSDATLTTHISVFSVASRLVMPALVQLAEAKFRDTLNNHVADIDLYFAAVRHIYAAAAMPGLREAVVEAAVTEMARLLGPECRAGFLVLTADLPDFQADIYLFLTHLPMRPVEVVVPALCPTCGPRAHGDGYEVTTACKACGLDCTLAFL
ncbi:hypothetical protein BGHDH14_bgh03983 [Blumeria hordei DH14]|uniref:BTB domain-containing protein n=1 Tax=Blumeria graminis f. sp. hordei (strain DH14) TaxID=546991 RepID=N1JQZ1_BLUG1|nr:hypothetical protein BGHDH14_bgh03983 [Blumeria hordei DH14]